jgi:hypothetical protein
MDPGSVSAQDDPMGKIDIPPEDALLPLRSSLGGVSEPGIQVNGHGLVTSLFAKGGVGWERPRKRRKNLYPQKQGNQYPDVYW